MSTATPAVVTFIIIVAVGVCFNYDSDNNDLSKKIAKYEHTISGLQLKEQQLVECLEKTKWSAKKDAADLEKYITARYPGVAKEVAKITAISLAENCYKYNIPFELGVGLMERESMFNPFLVSKGVGARGLLQVRYEIWCENEDWANRFKISDPRELHGIETGIEAGLWILRHYLDKNNDSIVRSLKNYNGTSEDRFHTAVLCNAGRFSAFRRLWSGKANDADELPTEHSKVP